MNQLFPMIKTFSTEEELIISMIEEKTLFIIDYMHEHYQAISNFLLHKVECETQLNESQYLLVSSNEYILFSLHGILTEKYDFQCSYQSEIRSSTEIPEVTIDLIQQQTSNKLTINWKKKNKVSILLGDPESFSIVIRKKVVSFQHVKTIIFIEKEDEINKPYHQQSIESLLSVVPKNIQLCWFIKPSIPSPNKKQNEIFNIPSFPFQYPISILQYEEDKKRYKQLERYTIHINRPFCEYSKQTYKRMKQYYIQSSNEDEKITQLLRICKHVSIDHKVIIFCNSITQIERIEKELLSQEYSVITLHEQLSNDEINNRLDIFCDKQTQYLITTDFIVRYRCINDIPFIIHFDVPRYTVDYFRRLTRSRRFGLDGISLSFITDMNQLHQFDKVNNDYGITIIPFSIDFIMNL